MPENAPSRGRALGHGSAHFRVYGRHSANIICDFGPTTTPFGSLALPNSLNSFRSCDTVNQMSFDQSAVLPELLALSHEFGESGFVILGVGNTSCRVDDQTLFVKSS